MCNILIWGVLFLGVCLHLVVTEGEAQTQENVEQVNFLLK